MAENPQSVPSEIPQEAVAKFHSLTPEQQQTAIGRMTPELKQKFLPAALEYKAMHAPDSAYQRPSPPTPQPQNTMARGIDALAGFTTRNAPTIGGAVGGVLGSRAGLPGAVAGATVGGAAGEALRSKAQTGKISAKDVSISGAEQGALEFVGGMTAKGIGKVADLLGVKDALMRFALKTGRDFSKELDPAAALNRYGIQARTAKQLYEITGQRISSLTKTADAMIDQVAPYSSTIRPYAVAKGVLDDYIAKANKIGNPRVRDAMKEMLENLAQEFNSAGAASPRGAAQAGLEQTVNAARQGAIQGGTPVGAMALQNAERSRIAALPSDRIMTTQEANQLKRAWGKSVNWDKTPAQDPLQEAYKAVNSAREDIYHALNESISDAMGGNQGKQWRAVDRDIFQLMEAQHALNETGKRIPGEAKFALPTVMDMMRMPGPASMATRAVPSASSPGLQLAIPNALRLGTTAGNELLGPSQNQNPIPTTP